MDDQGFIKANDLMETSIPGVFAAGEVADFAFQAGDHIGRDGSGSRHPGNTFSRK